MYIAKANQSVNRTPERLAALRVRLSRDLAVPPNRISEIVNGKRAITADTALRLEHYFGVEAQFWLNLQCEYDLRIMKRKIDPDIEQRILPVKKYRSYASRGIPRQPGSEEPDQAPGNLFSIG